MFPLLFAQMGYGLLCALWVWHRRTNRWRCCPPMSNPSSSPWTAWPDGSGRWDNRMAAQHPPRDLVQPSSGYEELSHKKKSQNMVHQHSKHGWLIYITVLYFIHIWPFFGKLSSMWKKILSIHIVKNCVFRNSTEVNVHEILKVSITPL